MIKIRRELMQDARRIGMREITHQFGEALMIDWQIHIDEDGKVMVVVFATTKDYGNRSHTVVIA